MIDCKQAVNRLWDYIEKALSRQAEEEMDEHLSLCRHCCGEVEFAQELRQMLQSPEPGLPDDTARRLSEYIGRLEENQR